MGLDLRYLTIWHPAIHDLALFSERSTWILRDFAMRNMYVIKVSRRVSPLATKRFASPSPTG